MSDKDCNMVICQNCGAENKVGEVYCYSCGSLLQPISNSGDTSVLKDETGNVNPKRRWGTARFDMESILTLTLRDYDTATIRVILNSDKIIGRLYGDFVPDIDLSPYDAFDRGVSRQHAVLRRQNDTVVVVDLNSANSTFLNGQRLVPDQPRILRDGDELRFGQLVLRVTFEDAFIE